MDSCTVEEFDERLECIKPIWNARESMSGSCFHSYFAKYQADVVRYHMRRDLREACGLGSPPSEFTTNSSESINAALKRKVDHKESDWPQFNEHMKMYVESQREEIARALSGRGQYRLNPEFSHCGVSTHEWMKMRPDQRQQILYKFQEATLPEYGQKQNKLSALTMPAPGENKKAKMVLSYSQATPHYVQVKSDSQYVCDETCLQWASSQICSHTVAASECNGELELFLRWYISCAENPNISTLAMSGLPRGRGNKGGKPKRQRARQQKPLPDNYSLRLGLQPTLPAWPGTVNTGEIVRPGLQPTLPAGAGTGEIGRPELQPTLPAGARTGEIGRPELQPTLPAGAGIANTGQIGRPGLQQMLPAWAGTVHTGQIGRPGLHLHCLLELGL